MNTLKGVALVYFLVKEIYKKYRNVQIGRTVVQKMIYLLGRERGYDFGFSMYHYGPYSPAVSYYLDLAEAMGLLNINWEPEKGYFIKPLKIDNTSEIYQTLQKNIEEDKEKIKQVVKDYGNLEPLAIKLSIIASALYIKDNYHVQRKEEIIEIVKALKPEYPHLVEETINELKIYKCP